MSADFLAAEQVGFLAACENATSDAHLEMMGGEFCVNAIRCVSALLHGRHRPQTEFIVECSGAQEPVLCRSRWVRANRRYVNATFELSSEVEELPHGRSLVRLNGITYVVADLTVAGRLSNTDVSRAFVEASQEFTAQLMDTPAFGVVPYIADGDTLRVHPVIHVRATDTTVYETGCGSGSIAVALCRKNRSGPHTIVCFNRAGRSMT